MPDGEEPRRHWRVIAQELARESDPLKVSVLIDELSRAIQFVRYDAEKDDVAVARKPI
jgi:hypothetical protein